MPFATPQPVVDKLSAELRYVVMNTDVNEKLKQIFTTPVGKSPEETTRRMAGERSPNVEGRDREGEPEAQRVAVT